MFDLDLMHKNQTYDKQRKHTTASGKYFISTNLTWDQGWETMVFNRNTQTGDIDFAEVDVDRYNDETEAYKGHENMIRKWEDKN